MDRRFVGFDAYRKAIDCLRPGDVAMLTGYSAFRPRQLEYAVEKGINVFMEKSFGPDAPALRRVMASGDAAAKKNVKIAAGLHCRHSINRQALIERIREGELGHIQLLRAYRMQPVGRLGPAPGGRKGPVLADSPLCPFSLGIGRAVRRDEHPPDRRTLLDKRLLSGLSPRHRRAGPDSTDCSQNLDNLAIEWTFADGTRALDVVRWLPGCHEDFATYIHGTKCAGQFSGPHHPGTVHTYKDQR